MGRVVLDETPAVAATHDPVLVDAADIVLSPRGPHSPMGEPIPLTQAPA